MDIRLPNNLVEIREHEISQDTAGGTTTVLPHLITGRDVQIQSVTAYYALKIWRREINIRIAVGRLMKFK